MFIKRAKSRPSLRARDTEDDPVSTGSPLKNVIVASTEGSSGAPDEGEEEYRGGSVMERKKAKHKEKKIKNGGGRLSFGLSNQDEGQSAGLGDEQGTPFKTRKSLLSQSIRLPSTPTSGSPLSNPTTDPPTSSSIYSREYLEELKASTPNRTTKSSDDHAFSSVDASIPGGGGGGGVSLAEEKYGQMVLEDRESGIPDQVAINAARQKRQAKLAAARTKGMGEEDFIALGGGQVAVWDGEKGPHPESRLMREEDEGDEGDEDMADYTEAKDRLYIGKQANKTAARRLKGEIGELIDDREAEDEDDEEMREWEEAQVRRGGNWEPERAVTETVAPVLGSAPIPIVRPVPTVASAAARIAKALEDAQAIRSEVQKNLEIAARDLTLLEEQERDLRKEVERVEGKREWVEEFRGWIEMLGRFLEEKVPKLNTIESDGINHLRERHELVSKRRKLDDEDDLALFLGAARPAPDEVDEMGRSREIEAGPSSAVRKARRAERTKRRARRPRAEEEGYSTDSSLDEGDENDYEAAQKDLRRRTKGLLEDVKADDFKDPEKGLAIRFGDWRKRYEEEYVGAFGGLSLVQAWEFYARSEMIGWEPLRASTSLDSFDWFHSLHAYSRPSIPKDPNGDDDDMDMDDEPPLGPDGDLVIEMVQKTVVPLLTKQFEAGAYDPYSIRQTRKAIDLVEVVSDLMGKGHSKYITLLRSILAVFNGTIVNLANDVAKASGLDAVRPPDFNPESRVALGRFVRKRVKLLENALLWRRMAPGEVKEIVNRIVGEVLRPILEKQWDGGGRELSHEVASASGSELRPDLSAFLREGPVRRACDITLTLLPTAGFDLTLRLLGHLLQRKIPQLLLLFGKIDKGAF